MIEELAKEVFNARHRPFERWEDASDKRQEKYRKVVWLTLKALETPTPVMIEAGVAVQNANRWPRVTKAELVEDIFAAMTQAAAGERADD